MDLLAQYSGDDDSPQRASGADSDAPGSGDEAAAAAAAGRPTRLAAPPSAAPAVDTGGLVLRDGAAVPVAGAVMLLEAGARSVKFNLPYSAMAAPVVGPAHPFQKDGLAAGMKNHRSGFVEDMHLHSYAFDEQYQSFHAQGRAAAPSGQGVVSHYDPLKAAAARQAGAAGAGGGGGGGDSGDGGVFGPAAKRRRTTAEKKEAAARRAAAAAAPVDPDQPFTLGARLPWADKEVVMPEPTDEQKEHAAKVAGGNEEAAAAAVEAKGATTFFHGKEDKDYQGRSWMDVPRGERRPKQDSDYCFLPKRWLHTWSGHTKGVNAIRFFPKTGHLLLSAGLDGKVKIWDVFGGGKCMRTYLGHSKGVRDINFTNDGKRFISVGYDKNIRLWDTETGQVIRTLNTGKMYYCGVFHPDDDKQNVLMAGCADKKVYQFDLDSGDVVQEYNYHLGAVNSVTFFDDGRRFVSSSDDKTLRVWEFGIPVQIKYIADPSMHSMPAVARHPSGNFLICQSLDNQVVTYTTKDGRFKQNRKKTFKGHNTAGYACQVGFSPDARYVLSGDSEGRAFFWEWAAPTKVVRTIKAHDGVCIGAAWHPLESSKVATCGWDGLIKYWD